MRFRHTAAASLLLIIGSCQGAYSEPPPRWNTPTVVVTYDHTGLERDRWLFAFMLRHATYGWQMRLGQPIMTVLSFDRPERSIHVKSSIWMPIYQWGRTDLFWWPKTGQISYADIVINAQVWRGLSYECKLFLLAHEMGHALGFSGHSDDPADVMYGSAERGCQHTITARDAMFLGGFGDLCSAELSPLGYVYIPSIAGHGVRLDPVREGKEYRISYDHDSGLTCSGSVDGYSVILDRVDSLLFSAENVMLRLTDDGRVIVE
jgi:hypothetical protein